MANNTPKKTGTRRSKKQIMMDMLMDLHKMVQENCEKPVAVTPTATKTAAAKTPRTKKGTQAPVNNMSTANTAPKATVVTTNKKCKGVATYNDFLKKYVQDHAEEYKAATGQDLTYAIARNGAGTEAYRQMCGLPPKPSKRTLGLPFTRKTQAANVNTAVAPTATAKPKATRKSKKAVPASNMIFNTLAAVTPKATRKTKKKVQIKNTPINLVAEAEAETLDQLAAETGVARTFEPRTPNGTPPATAQRTFEPRTPNGTPPAQRTFEPRTPPGTPPGAKNLFTDLGVDNMGMRKVRLRNGGVYAMTNEGNGRRGLLTTNGGDNIEWVGYLENDGSIRRTNAPNEA